MTAVIQLKDVIKEYQQGETVIRALDGINLTVEKGDFVAIMGPSGCGKSTLMHTLGFLDRPTSGQYLLDGHDATTLSEDERAAIRNQKIGFVFQAFNLLPRTSVLENVLLPTTYAKGVDAAKARERALMLLAKVNMSHRINNNPNQLSGGEMQRTAIARALINSPSIILADEPTGNLDSRTTEEVMQIIEELNREGNTIILVTHEDDIGQRAKRIVRMKDGKVVSGG
ncbi:MAG: Macrolide export ATP-binding/permease protein MacB [Candidatus Parcubacteria bacterium]|jgi:putative ABC transport system ATP-binding protein